MIGLYYNLILYFSTQHIIIFYNKKWYLFNKFYIETIKYL